MTKHRLRTRRLGWAAALAVVALAAAGTGSAADKEPAKKVATLQHRLAALQKQNERLQAYAPAAIAKQLAALTASIKKYESVAAAKADGYRAESPCEATPTDGDASWWGGAMGVHFVDDALLKAPPNPTRPPILLYAPKTGGGFRLLGAEYFKPDADQNVKTDDDRPTLFGRAFDGPMLGHAPGMPIHYDLHIWLFEHNPSGLFAPYNPDVSCGG